MDTEWDEITTGLKIRESRSLHAAYIQFTVHGNHTYLA